jgi:prepilin-type N-terminal cleavage/methylation domain-containing protein
MKPVTHWTKRPGGSRVNQGFTLVEMAMVLVIMGLLLGGGLTLLSTQIEQQKVKGTERQLEEVKEALIGFAIANRRLPRPSSVLLNGVEMPGTCVSDAACTGLIPWATLGVNKLDGWDKIVRYSVTPLFANSTFGFATFSSKKIQTRNAAGALTFVAGTAAACNSLNGCIPAVVFSHGRINFGTTDAGTAIPNQSPGATNVDEISNNTGTVGASAPGTTFIQRTPSEGTTLGGEFDDIVTWLSPNILFSRMVQAGRLP